MPRTHPSLAGDHGDEAATRQAYEHVLAVSLPVVRELAASLDGTEPPSPSVASDADGATAAARGGSGRRTLRTRPPSPDPEARRRTALEHGWLVTEAAETSKGSSGSLQGLEVAVKDLIDVAGLPVRNGTPGGLWRQPATSAPAWQALADAGARCIGKAATHEMAWGVTTPQIGNPFDLDRVTGGSSGGSAACVASGVAGAALGTDTGGSIRIPAALCGVVGVRPTHGAITLAGITPLAPSQDVVGPLAGDVDTCAAVLEVLTGRPLGLPPGTSTPRRVGVLADPGALDAGVTAAYDRARILLAEGDVELVDCPATLLRAAAALSVATMLAESAVLHADAVRADPQGFGGEARALLTIGAELADEAQLLHRARRVLRSRTAMLFARNRLDAFLTPTTACVAPRRDADAVRLGERDVPVATALSRFTAWSAATGWPSISVPGLAAPLPTGLQFMAPPNREDVCVALAELVEDRANSG